MWVGTYSGSWRFPPSLVIIHNIERFEEVLYALVDYSLEVSKPNNEFRLTEWEYTCPVAPDVFWKLVKQHIQDNVTYTQQLGMAQEFHCEYIKLLLEVVIKYFSWHSQYPCLENVLELSASINRALKKTTVPINKEPYWVLKNWHHIMAFMICGTHLEKEVHTAGDLSDLVLWGIGSYLQSPRNKGKGSGRALKTST